MAKKLQEWLDEFIENGFSPDVNHWPEEGSVETNQPSVNITPSTSEQIILPDEGYIGFDQAVVAAVDSTIDSNIQAGNIKKNVTILGVTGNYEAPEVPVYTGSYNITENSTIAINGKQATQDIIVNVPQPVVPAYTGPYTITENSTIAISGKRATQDISVEVSSPTYDSGVYYFYDDNVVPCDYGYYDGGVGVYIVRYDEQEDEYTLTQVGSGLDTIYLPDEELGLHTNSMWTYSGSNVLYTLGGSGGSHPSAGLYWVKDGGEYECVSLPSSDLVAEDFEDYWNTYYIFKGIGSGLYDATDFFSDRSLVEVTTRVSDDYIYWKEDDTWNSYNLSNGEIIYRDYDNDSIYNLGSWGGSGIYQVEENGTSIIELERNESTEVTVDGKTYTITRTI